MRAKVIKTGEIVEVYHEPQHGQVSNIYKESVFVNGRTFTENELEFCEMSRNEEIEHASVEYQMEKRPMALGGDMFDDMIYRMNINPSFIAGAEWADSHPFHNEDVDLEKAIQQHINECLDIKFPTTDINAIKSDVEYTARMFFELGLKAQKRE